MLNKVEEEYEDYRYFRGVKSVKKELKKKAAKNFSLYFLIFAVLMYLVIGIPQDILEVLSLCGACILIPTIFTWDSCRWPLKRAKEKSAKKASLEEEQEYLKDHIAHKRLCLAELFVSKNRDQETPGNGVNLMAYNAEFERRQRVRLKIIETLETFKKEAIASYKEGTFEQFLKIHTIRPETTEEEQEFISKRISMCSKEGGKR